MSIEALIQLLASKGYGVNIGSRPGDLYSISAFGVYKKLGAKRGYACVSSGDLESALEKVLRELDTPYESVVKVALDPEEIASILADLEL